MPSTRRSLADVPAISDSAVVVRDAAGHLHRFAGDLGTLGGRPHRLNVPLGDAAVPGRSPRFSYPLELLAVEVAAQPADGLEATEATLTVHGVAAIADGAGRTVALDARPRLAHHVVRLRPAACRGNEQRGCGADRRDRRRAGCRSSAAWTGSVAGPIVTFAPARARRGRRGAGAGRRDRSFLEATGGAVGDELSCRSPASIAGRRSSARSARSRRPTLRAAPAHGPADPRAPAVRGERRGRRGRGMVVRGRPGAARGASIACVPRRSAAARW